MGVVLGMAASLQSRCVFDICAPSLQYLNIFPLPDNQPKGTECKKDSQGVWGL